MRVLLLTASVLVVLSGAVQAQNTVTLKTHRDSVSYAIGMSIGSNLKMQNIDVDVAILAAGMAARINEKDLAFSEEKASEIMIAFQQEMMAKQQEASAAAGAKNRELGAAFLAENAKKEGVKTTASGLQYKVLVEGKGAVPTRESTVVTHYRGTLIDGKEFDSSYKRGQPAEFPVTGVIKGWTEALLMMPVGSKWMLYLPADLAYADQAMGPDIQPGSTLVFEIELLEIKK